MRSEGSYLVDDRGRKYIDFLTGWNVGNLGWGNRDIKAAMSRFKGPDYIYPYYLYKPWTELAKLLAELTPGKLKKSFRATGGTEAVEIALQLTMGLLVTSEDEALTMYPALNIDQRVAREGLDILEQCL